MTELEKQLAIIIEHDSDCGGFFSHDLYGEYDCDCHLNSKVKKILRLFTRVNRHLNEKEKEQWQR
jgi:hypothetical protein